MLPRSRTSAPAPPSHNRRPMFQRLERFFFCLSCLFRWAYGDDGGSKVPLLDDFFTRATALCSASLATYDRAPNEDARYSGPVLHERIYLIWKFPQFCTACVRMQHRAVLFVLFVGVRCRLVACYCRPAPRCAAGTTRTHTCGHTRRFTTRSRAAPCFTWCLFSSVRSLGGSSVCAHFISRYSFANCIVCPACAQGSTSRSWESTTVRARYKSSCSPRRSSVSRNACGCRCDSDCIFSHPQEMRC